jgi:hypothetical protein
MKTWQETYKEKTEYYISIGLNDHCNSKCPLCARHRLKELGLDTVPEVNKYHVTLDDFKKWFPKETLEQIQVFSLQSAVSEPSLCKDLFLILDYLYECNPAIQIKMSSNGYANSEDWWKTLAQKLSRFESGKKLHILSSYVKFFLDGLEDTYSLYRVGLDYNTVVRNARAFISAGGNAFWMMILFEHNQHQLEECEKLAKEYGFNYFGHRITEGFEDIDSLEYQYKGQTHLLKSPSSKTRGTLGNPIRFESSKFTDNPWNISCGGIWNNEYKCPTRNVRVDNRGIVLPCGFYESKIRFIYSEFYKTGNINCDPIKIEHDNSPIRSNLKLFYDTCIPYFEDNGGLKSISLEHNTFLDIVNSQFYNEILPKMHFSSDTNFCAFMCSKFSKCEKRGTSSNQNLRKDKVNRINFK